MCGFAFAQSSFPELDKVKKIKLLDSTREEVKKIFDDDDEESDGDYYSTENFRIHLAYSNGDCGEEDSDDGWNVPEGIVVEINVIIEDSDVLKKLKIDLSKLERINKYERDADDEEEEEDPDDYVYYDKENGVSYGLDDGEIANIKFTPLEKNAPALCSNEELREFSSTGEWFLNRIKSRPSRGAGGRPFANIAELALSKNEITAYCITEDSPKGEICSEDAEIEIAAKGESTDPTDVLTYNYTVSGGKITGSGTNVTWDLTGVKPGKYTITAGVDNGCGVCGTTKTEVVEIKDCPDCQQKENK
jgi:hypothetical protein